MSSSALFASSAGRSHSKNLVEFKAGKMTMKGKMVHPDKRKGLLYVYQSEDSLMHFCWKDRGTGSVEDDLIIFPDDCEFKRVDACTTGRVYVLKFKSSSRKLFFWLQEAKTEKDEEYCKKVNEMLNSPPTAGASRSGGGTPDELQNLLGSMSQQQLMQLFGTFGPGGAGGVQLPSTLSSLLGTMGRNNGSPSSGSSSARTSAAVDKASTPTPSDSAKKSSSSSGSSSGNSSSSSKPVTSAAPSTPQPTILLSDLQRYLHMIRTPATPSVEVDLSDALLNAESIQGVLNDPSLVQELSPHLPDVSTDQADPERLRSTLLSPQFQQGNMEEFVKALEKANITPEKSDGGSSSNEQKSDAKEKKEESKEGDEKMNED